MNIQIKGLLLGVLVSTYFFACDTTQRNYSHGKNIYYKQCISCHLVQGVVEADRKLNISAFTLYDMYSQKDLIVQFRNNLRDSNYHEIPKGQLTKEDVENLAYFINHSFDPKPNK